jgi:hypothetical protein
MKLHPAGKVVAWSAVGVLALAGAAGAAESIGSPNTAASTSGTAGTAVSPSPAAPGTARPGHRRGRALAERALHGEFVVLGKGGKPVTLDMQRGTITIGSSHNGITSFTVTSSDGFSATYQANSSTKVRTGPAGTGTLANIHPGTMVGVVAVNDGTAKTARTVRTLVARTHIKRGMSGTPTPTPAVPGADRSGGAAPKDQGLTPLGA